MKKLESKLILIEGLPSTGKSTTAELTKEILDEMNIDNELVLEGNLDHPADYDGVAYFTKNQLKKLKNKYSEYEEFINKIVEKREEGHFISYIKRIKEYGDDFPKELFREIKKYDIYEIPLDLNRKLILNKWERFMKKVQKQDKVYIFECVFIQNPVTVSIIRNNASIDTAYSYIKELKDIIDELNPVLIYLEQNDIESSFNKVIEERPEWWLDFFIDYYTNYEFGEERNLEGLKGTIKGLKEIDSIQKELISKLEMQKYTLDNSHYNLEKSKNNIKNILKGIIK